MEPTFQDLLERLEEIQDHYRQMLELAGKKQKELVKGNLEQIEALTKEEEKLIFKIGRLEDERHHCARRLISHFQLREEATLTDLMEVAPAEVKDKLQALQESMAQLIAEMDKLNQENINLIQQSLRFINFTVDLLTKADDPSTYGSGKEANAKPDTISRLVDKKI